MKKEKRCPICNKKTGGGKCTACILGIRPMRDQYSREDMNKLEYRSDLLGQEAIRTMNGNK